jgi:hypothetical protein
MKPILGALAAGVAGNALFALINSLFPFVEGQAWWWSMGGVFAGFATLAYLLLLKDDADEKAPQSSGEVSVGSDLESGGAMDVNVGSVKAGSKDKVAVLSGNKSKGDMKLLAKDVDLS